MKKPELPYDAAWTALNHASDVIICLDGQRNIIHINEAVKSKLGYEAAELLGFPIDRISPAFPALPDSIRQGGDKTNVFQAQFIPKDGGTMVPCEVALASFVMDNQAYFWVFARDITLRLSTMEALRQSELKFRGAFNDAAVGMAIFSPEGYFLEVNPYLCKTLGYSQDEFRKFHFLDITHPDDIESCARYDAMIRQKEISFAYHEKRYIAKNGKAVWFLASDSLMLDESGNEIYILAHFQNITKRKESEHAVIAGEKRFKLFMDNMPGMAFIKNQEGRYVFGNRFMEQRIKGRELAGISGKTDSQIYRPEYAKRILGNDQEVLSTGEPAEMIEKRPGAAGDEEWLVSRFPIKHDDGSTLLGGVAVEVSTLLQTQRALEDKEKQLKAQTVNLERLNTAMKVLLDHREQEKIQLQDGMAATLDKLVLPYLQDAYKAGSTNEMQTYLNIAISNLKDILAPFAGRLSAAQTKLSPAELRVADLLRHEKTTAEIAGLLSISSYTVSRHRESIRRKLGLTNQKVNLKSYLKTIS
jgi:PAS domain S-box-containing protein